MVFPPLVFASWSKVKRSSDGEKRVPVCFLGGARYSRPLDPTAAKKFRLLSQIAEIHVVGFNRKAGWASFTEHADFHLLPLLPSPWLRYIQFALATPFLVVWLMRTAGLRTVVAQSPYEAVIPALIKGLASVFGVRMALIVESHGDFERAVFLLRKVRFAALQRKMMRRLAHFSLGMADALRCISDSTERQLRGWAPGRAIVQFPTWTDIDVFLQAEAGEPDDEGPTVVYAGDLTPLKGLHFLLEAFDSVRKKVPRARLLLIGEATNPTYARQLQRRARRMGGSVRFLDKMPQARLAQRMAAADVLVLPSLSEGLGRVLLEAMACGTPVIATEVGGIVDVVSPGENGYLVPAGDPEALARRILQLLENPLKAAEMGRVGRESVREMFSKERYLAGYARLLELACASRIGDKGIR